ncbi:MAG: site-specific integrase [Bacteroidetes bacterium]|nr:MAG: site-specific integrase [Bacteroidota bacterium]
MNAPSYSPVTPMIDFTPAILHQGKTWYISFKVRPPGSGQLKEVRYKFNRITDLHRRKKEGLKRCEESTIKLAAGWNPFIHSNSGRSFETIEKAFTEYLNEKEYLATKNSMRADSIRAYVSYLRNFEKWAGPKILQKPCSYLSTELIDAFSVHILEERQRSTRTRNNYMSFFNHMCQWMLRKKFIQINPVSSIAKLPEGKKKRTVIPRSTLKTILSYLEDNLPYRTLCLTIYYTFVRRKELCEIQVKHINLARQTLYIPADISKNKRDQVVTLPNDLIEALKIHLKRAKPEYYVFSLNGFRPGIKPSPVKKVSDQWAKLRRELELPSEYQFYSLKDTGITDMLRRGVPILIVRDQARHYDISITDKYTPKEDQNAAPELLNYSQDL